MRDREGLAAPVCKPSSVMLVSNGGGCMREQILNEIRKFALANDGRAPGFAFLSAKLAFARGLGAECFGRDGVMP